MEWGRRSEEGGGGMGGKPAPLFHNQYDKYSVHKKCSNYREKGRDLRIQHTCAGCSILFTAVSDDMLTNLRQLSAPSGSISGPRPCQNTAWCEHWELMFQILLPGRRREIQGNFVQCLPAGTSPPSLLEN